MKFGVQVGIPPKVVMRPPPQTYICVQFSRAAHAGGNSSNALLIQYPHLEVKGHIPCNSSIFRHHDIRSPHPVSVALKPLTPLGMGRSLRSIEFLAGGGRKHGQRRLFTIADFSA